MRGAATLRRDYASIASRLHCTATDSTYLNYTCKKLLQRSQYPLECGAVIFRQCRCELTLNLSHLIRPCGFPLLTERGDRGPNDPAIARIVYPANQSLRLQTVNQLGHVRSDTTHSSSQLTQGERLSCARELGEDSMLSGRKAYGGKPLFEPSLNGVSGCE